MPALLLFIKNPIPGKTKTRLAADVGNEMALKMYHRLTDWTREQAAGLQGINRHLWYSNFIPETDNWPTDEFEKFVQQGEGLGERMEAAFAHAFAMGQDRVVVIGSDCPGITTEYLRQAFEALESSDLVVGPALDGGYTLLGMRKLHPTLFREMNWSTSEVLPDTLARAAAAHLKVTKLSPLSDVDYLEDWLGYGWALPEEE